jgi:hypothetical protein
MAVEQRANIKFCFKLGKTAREAYEMMNNVYGSDCVSRSNIFRWYAVFRDGREDTEDAPRACVPLHSYRRESFGSPNQSISSFGSCKRLPLITSQQIFVYISLVPPEPICLLGCSSSESSISTIARERTVEQKQRLVAS